MSRGSFIDLEAKKEYIRWFLSSFAFKRRDSRSILRFLLENEGMLENVHFVENLSYVESALLISAKGSNTYPFMFRDKGEFIYSPALAIQRLDEREEGHPVYIWLAYDPLIAPPDDFAVVEENPMLAWRSRAQRVVRQLIRSVEEEMNALVFRREELGRLIDQALERGDREAFMRYTGELADIERKVS